MTEGDGAEALYREAIDRLGRTRYRLHKVFTELAISSRNQLHGAMARGSRE